MEGPRQIRAADVSVVVPVRDNPAGVQRFLDALRFHPTLPGEVIVVDNGSSPPMRLAESELTIPVRLIRCEKAGPASARNAGAAVAAGRWLLFADSDCVPTSTLVSGYARHADGAVAYAGGVASLGQDRLSRYYASQEILVPPSAPHGRPHYLITANTLIWRTAFEAVGGFDETYREAGGEDVDLGFRLSSVGDLSYAPSSVVHHDFSDGYRGFVRRFVRYGRGNRALAERHGIDLTPHPFVPNHPTAFNRVVALLQYGALAYGYRSGPSR